MHNHALKAKGKHGISQGGFVDGGEVMRDLRRAIVFFKSKIGQTNKKTTKGNPNLRDRKQHGEGDKSERE